MHSSSFKILQKKYPELFNIAIQAERYAHSDHSGFLLKIRMFLEIWCHEIAYQQLKQDHIEPKLFDKIEQLRTLSLIDHQRASVLHETRTICNRGVHLVFDKQRGFCQVLEVTEHEINLCLNTIYQLSASIIGEKNMAPGAGLQLSAQAKLDSAVMQGFAGDGKASLTAAKVIHADLKTAKSKSRFKFDDLDYWLDKALQQGCFEALEFYSQLVIEKRYVQLDLTSLKHWLGQFKHLQQNSDYAYIAAKTYEKLGEMTVALKHYQRAAEEGCFNSLKRLQDHWIKRDEAKFVEIISLGDQFNERRSIYYFLMFQIIGLKDDSLSAQEKEEKITNLKQQYRKAKTFSVDGFDYAEALMAQEQLLNCHTTITDPIKAVESSWLKAPRYYLIDSTVFMLLFNQGVLEPFMVEFAENIMLSCTDMREMANLEVSLAVLQWHLISQRKIFKAKQTSRELFKSAARKGNAEAKAFLHNHSGRFAKAGQAAHLPKTRVVMNKKAG